MMGAWIRTVIQCIRLTFDQYLYCKLYQIRSTFISRISWNQAEYVLFLLTLSFLSSFRIFRQKSFAYSSVHSVASFFAPEPQLLIHTPCLNRSMLGCLRVLRGSSVFSRPCSFCHGRVREWKFGHNWRRTQMFWHVIATKCSWMDEHERREGELRGPFHGIETATR